MKTTRKYYGASIQPTTDVVKQGIASSVVQEVAGNKYSGKVVLSIVNGGVICTNPPLKPYSDRKLLKKMQTFLPSKCWSGDVVIDSHLGITKPDWEFISKIKNK